MPVKESHRAILYFTAIVSGCLKMPDATLNHRKGEFGGGGVKGVTLPHPHAEYTSWIVSYAEMKWPHERPLMTPTPT